MMAFKVQTHLKVLKSKDVQDADGSKVLFAPDSVVQLTDDPVETLRIKCHGHGVSGVHRLFRRRYCWCMAQKHSTYFL